MSGKVYPNPFNPNTKIFLNIPKDRYGTLAIYSVDGSEVLRLKSGYFSAGSHSYEWSGVDSQGRSVPSGTYLYKFSGEKGLNLTGKMVLLK